MKLSRSLDLSAPACLSALALLALGCPSGAPPAGGPEQSGTNAVAAAEKSSYELAIPDVTYRWDPAAGDPQVSAEDGGPGFTGEGWLTKMSFPAMGSAEAVRGGSLTWHMNDWPATFRLAGKDHNQQFNSTVRDLCYTTLLKLHPTTLEFGPNLATHWWISDDKSTYRFRINPKARWSDGSEITADDVVATFKLRMDPDTLEPSAQFTFGKMEQPTAISKYIVEVKVKEESWRNFLYFVEGALPIFPASDVSIPGGEYLSKYQFAYTKFSGPYEVDLDSIVTGQEVSLQRRDDWWDEGNPAWTGLNNLDRIRFIVVKDSNLAFEKVKKGELDYFPVGKAQWWAEELDPLDSVQRGLLLKAKFFNDNPVGISGIAINMSRKPWDDKRLRLALQLLTDRETLIRQLYFDEYLPMSSYYQGGMYQNRDNVLHPYDPFGAVELLEEAGWTEINDEGYRVKDGQELRASLIYRSPLSERNLTVFQEACKDAGIRLELQLLTPAALWKTIRQKDFELASMAWTGLTFPNPETSFHSRLKELVDNNNITAFGNARLDELCGEYDREYDVQRRREIIQEIDGILYEEVPYVLHWYNPSERLIAWNKFSWPEWGSFRAADMGADLFYTWWVDPEKEALLEKAKNDPSITMPRPEVHNHFWTEWNKAQAATN